MTTTRPSTPPIDWYDDDTMWEAFASVIFSKVRMARAQGDVDGIIHLIDLAAGAAVLDVCCGIGRHSLELARRGFAVTGVDRTPTFVMRARQQANEENLAVEVVQGDVRSFRRHRAFDAVISMYTSFGYFEDIADDIKQLTNACYSLRRGGALLIETLGKEATVRNLRDRTWLEIDSNLVLFEHVIMGPWDRIELRWKLIRPDGSRADAALNIRLYSAVELAAVLRDAGFTSVAFYGDLAGSPYDADAREMVAIARK